jgi:hypothetical protein
LIPTDGIHFLKVFVNDSVGNINSIYLEFISDITSPIIVNNFLTNNTYLQSGFIINLNVSDELAGVDTVWYEWDSNGTIFYLNVPYNINLISGDGLHGLQIFTNDSVGNINSLYLEFITDDTLPIIQHNYPNNETTQLQGTFINFDIYDSLSGLDYVLYEWDNNGTKYIFNSPYNLSMIPIYGKHSLWIYVNDSASNNVSLYLEFTVDNKPPTIVLSSPINGTSQRPGTLINLSITDADFVWYQWDTNGTNITLNLPYYLFLIPSEGQHNLIIFANDSYGNNDYLYLEFVTDDTKPIITYYSPNNNSFQRSGTLINLSIMDSLSGIDFVWFEWDNELNKQIITYPYHLYITSTEGLHNLTIITNDTAGNVNSIYLEFIVDNSSPEIQLNSPNNSSSLIPGTLINFSISDSLSGLKSVKFQWDNNGTIFNFNSPYDLFINSKEGPHSLTIYANDTLNNNVTILYIFFTDSSGPIIQINFPSNNTYQRSGSLISLSITDLFSNINTSSYEWDNNGTRILFYYPFNVILIPGDGIHLLKIYANDTLNNSNVYLIFFTTDDSIPNIVLNSPVNNSIIKLGDKISFSFSDSYSGLEKIWYNWDNQPTSFIFDFNSEIDIIGVDGKHNLFIYANDSVGNMKFLLFIFITDKSAPSIILNLILNNSFQKSGKVIDFSINDSISGIDTVWYQWDNNENKIFLLTPFDIVLLGENGTHHLLIFANDTIGNSISLIYIFITDDNPPEINLLYPLNKSKNKASIEISLDVLDTLSGVEQILYYWDSDNSNKSLAVLQQFNLSMLPTNVY